MGAALRVVMVTLKDRPLCFFRHLPHTHLLLMGLILLLLLFIICLLVNYIMIAFLPPKSVEKKHERLQLKHIREVTSTLITH